MVEADPRMAGRADAGGRIDVLEGERDAVQRAAIAARHDLALGLVGLVERPLGGRQQVGVELCIQRLGSPDQRGRQFDRRKPLCSISRAASAIVRKASSSAISGTSRLF